MFQFLIQKVCERPCIILDSQCENIVQIHFIRALGFFSWLGMGNLCFHCALKVSKYARRALLKFSAPPVVKMFSESSVGKLIN